MVVTGEDNVNRRICYCNNLIIILSPMIEGISINLSSFYTTTEEEEVANKSLLQL